MLASRVSRLTSLAGVRRAAVAQPSGQVSLAQLEQRWPTLSNADREATKNAILSVMKGDWKSMSADQKRAAYFVAYGSRKAAESHRVVVVGGVAALCGASYGLWKLSQSLGKEKPITMTREWQEETNRRQREAKSNPIFGLSSEHPTGPGHVQSK